jgi:hypothetical protein
VGRAEARRDARKDDKDFDEGLNFQIPETSLHRSILDLKEAVARFSRGAYEVSVGKQIFAWGTAEGFNPTDNLNAYDYLDPLDREKLGAWSVAARATFGPANLLFVIVPVFTPSRLPLSDSRWTPTPPGGFAGVPEPRELPSNDVGSMQYGARLRATLSGWDLGLSYYDGFDATPVYRTGTVDIGGASVSSPHSRLHARPRPRLRFLDHLQEARDPRRGRVPARLLERPGQPVPVDRRGGVHVGRRASLARPGERARRVRPRGHPRSGGQLHPSLRRVG